MATTEEYVNRIHQSFYPRWKYAGGWIIAEVSNDSGMDVTLLGYKNPSEQEREIFISKVKASVDDENPKIYWQRIDTSDRVELLSLEEVARKEAKEDIQRLIEFAKDTGKAIENKATQDNQTVRSLFEDTKRAREQNISDAGKSVEDIQRQAYQLLDRAARGVGQVVEPLEQTVTESWNQYWLERIFDSISSGVNLDNAKNVVRKLQQDNLQEQPSQIIDRLIGEKAIFATVVGLSSEEVTKLSGEPASLATLTSDLYSTTSLLAEMCYQIAVAYEVEDLHYSARQGEILAIFALALGSDRLVRLDLDFLLQNTPIPSWLINTATNVIVFQVVGYAAREFYKAKIKEKINPLASNAKFTQLETEIKSYLESVIEEKETIEQQVVAEAVRISRKLGS